MTCPICFGDDVSIVGESHYVCNNPDCKDSDGKRVQFRHVIDNKVHFPYNQIFVNRNVQEFYRKPLLEISSPGNAKIDK